MVEGKGKRGVVRWTYLVATTIVDGTRERERINNGESTLLVVGWPGQKLALDSIHDPSSKTDARRKGREERTWRRGPREKWKGAGWAGDLCELIKYASDLSSLHPRGHPGGTPV